MEVSLDPCAPGQRSGSEGAVGAVGEAPASEASAGGGWGPFDQVRPVLDIVNILTSKTIQVLPGDIIADVRSAGISG